MSHASFPVTMIFPSAIGWSETAYIGLAEHLFEKLTASPAEPHLKTLQELYVNFNREQSIHPL